MTRHLKVIGVGGGGLHALRRLTEPDMPPVELLAIDTDPSALEACIAPAKLTVPCPGPRVTAWPVREAANAFRAELERALGRANDVVVIAAGMGGSTGTGIVPVVAEIARSCGSVVIAVLTTPFSFEGRRRMKQAEDGVAAVTAAADEVVVLSNQELLANASSRDSLASRFRAADDALAAVVRGAARGFADGEPRHELIRVAFEDVRARIPARAGEP